MPRMLPLLFLVLATLRMGAQTTQSSSESNQPAKGRQANSTASAAVRPTRAEILKLFQALEVRKQIGAMAEAMQQSIQKMQDTAELSEKQRKELDQLNKEMY